jgi:hypothetical protein
MVGHAGVLPARGKVRDEAAEGGAVRQENGEMIEADVPAASNGAHSGFLVKLDEHTVVALRGEPRHGARAIDDPQSDHTFIIRDRAIEVRDLETDATDVRRVGESIARRANAVGSGYSFSRGRHASPSKTFLARLAPIRRLHRGVGAPPSDERID